MISKYDWKSSNSCSTDLKKYLGFGWSSFEDLHCWTVGRHASIHFSVPFIPAGGLICRFKCNPFIGIESIQEQKLTISANNRQIKELSIKDQSWFSIIIPKDLVQDGVVSIYFDIENPVSPFSCGLSADKRTLGIDLKCLQVFRLSDIDIDNNKLDWIGTGQDDIGQVFFLNGNYYRAIKKDKLEFVMELLNNGIYSVLQEKKMIPEFCFYSTNSSDFPLVVWTAPGVFVHPAKFPIQLLQDTAFLWVKINTMLLTCSNNLECGLRDGHYGNIILTENMRPLWCDFGSILTKKSNALHGGLRQFCRCFLFPLLLMHDKPENAKNIRNIMEHCGDGISFETFTQISSGQHHHEIDCIYHASDNRIGILKTINALLESFEFSNINSYWSNYRERTSLDWVWENDLEKQPLDIRHKTLLNMIKTLRFTTFIDIGCNDGLFSLMCCKFNHIGIAADTDEGAINKLYSFIKSNDKIQIHALFGDFETISAKATLVLALALTHHLFFTQKLSFLHIAKKLYDLSSSLVLTEFMPDGLGGTTKHPEKYPIPFPDDYNLENFIDALSVFFVKTDVINYETSSPFSRRILIICSKY